jgi:hypothetical protein
VGVSGRTRCAKEALCTSRGGICPAFVHVDGRWPLEYDASFEPGIAILLIIVIGLAIYSWSKEQTKPADSGEE